MVVIIETWYVKWKISKSFNTYQYVLIYQGAE